MQAEQRRAYEHGRLVRVKYLDHAIFLNASPKGLKPTVRETVGWLVEEGEEYLKIVWDRGARQKIFSATKDRDAGIVLVRQLVLEVGEVCGTPEVEEVRG